MIDQERRSDAPGSLEPADIWQISNRFVAEPDQMLEQVLPALQKKSLSFCNDGARLAKHG